MVVEAALGDVQFGRDLLHRCAAIAEFVDQARRRQQERLAARLRLVVAKIEQLWRPIRILAGDAVREHVHQPLLDAPILIGFVPRQPDRQPERILEQHVRACAVEIGLRTRRGRPPQQARPAEHLAPARHQPPAHRLLGGPQIGEDRERLLLAALDAGEPIHVKREIASHALLRRRLFHRDVEHRDQRFERVLERGGGKVFLALEIIGNAGRIEPDAPRHVRERHALGTLFVDRFCRRGEDRVTLRTEALGPLFALVAGLCRNLHRNTLTASI